MSDFTLGKHDAQLSALEDRTSRIEDSVSGVHAKLDAIGSVLAERRGERKTIAVLATIAGGIGSLLVSFLLEVL